MSTAEGNQPKHTRNPRRLLILSPSSHSLSLIPTLLHKLTAQPLVDPPAPTQTFAGYTTHPPLRIQNKYYAAEVPIWVDEIPLGRHPATSTLTSTSDSTEAAPEIATGEDQEVPAGTTTASQWETEFSGSEAQVVRDAIGAVVICVKNPEDVKSHPGPASAVAGAVEDRDDVQDVKDFIRAIGNVRALIEEERGEMGEVPAILVLSNRGEARKTVEKPDENVGVDGDSGLDDPFSIDWWEDQLCEMGLIGVEVVNWDMNGEEDEEQRNQYGEFQGMRRIKEVLETHDWAAGDGDLDTTMLGDDDLERELLGLSDGEGNGFDLEVNELEREMVGLRLAIERGGGDGNEDEDEEGNQEVEAEAVEGLMLRMQAIKDMSDEMPEKDRKRFAAKAIRDIMKEI